MTQVHGGEKKHNDEKLKYVDIQYVEDTGGDVEEGPVAGSSGRLDPEVAKYAANEVIEIDEETNRRLRRLIDRRILPVMVVTYFLQSLDKGTLSFSSIMDMPQDTGLVGQQYSWLTTCIYLAVLVVEYPINWLIQRLPLAKFFAFNICAWSLVLAFHALCHNFLGLIIVRTLLGAFEASCQPILMFMSSMWYKRSEQPMIVTLWFMMNGFQQIVGGLLAYGFSHIGRDGPILSWQALFLTYGCFTFMWGIYVLLFTPDSPMRAKCYSEEDKKLMIERVRSNQTGLQNKKFRIEQFYEALKDPQCWSYAAVNFLTALPNSGIGAFANLIISGFGFTVLQTQLLAMVLGAYMMFCLLTSTYLANRYGHTTLIMMAFVVPSIVGTIVLMIVSNTNTATQAGLLICYYLVVSFWGAQTLSLSLLTRNVGGQTKKSVATAMNFIFWAAGNAIGPQLFRSQDAPRYFLAFAVHIGCYVVLIIWLILLRFYFIYQNKKKARYLEEHREAMDQKGIHSFDDLTDLQNPNFVYSY